MSLKVSSKNKSTPRSSSAPACSLKMATISSRGNSLNVLNDSERTDGAGDEDFVLGGFAGFARDFYPAMIQLGDAVAHAELRRACGDWR